MFWRRDVRHLANAELQKRLALVRRQSAESEPWLDLLELALGESRDGAGWQDAAPTPPPERPAKTPLLFRAHLTVDRRTARRYVQRLLQRAAARADGAWGLRRIDVAAVIEAAVCQDDARIDALAAGGDPHPLRVVAQMAALPLLQACARATGWEAPPSWWEGYCPVCGAWPALAEFRGLERKRWLRCGRCGSGWEREWLRCPFCDEQSHEQLGYLAPEEGEATRKVEVCDSCKGYLKAHATISALPPWAVLLEDLTTVPLDVAALERGYRRPERPGYALEARVEDGGGWWRLRRRVEAVSTNLHQLSPGRGA